MWPKTAITERLSLEYPIIQAPMAAFSLAELVSEVSGAGGLGSLASATMSIAQLSDQAKAIRARTGRPFALNFFLHEAPKLDEARVARWQGRLSAYHRQLDSAGAAHDPATPQFAVPPPFDQAMLEQVLLIKPAAVSFHFGVPSSAVVSALKRAGIYVLASATHVKEALLLEQGGVDAVIAQGSEAGGHRGTFAVTPEQAALGLFALLPQIVDAVKLPVIATGGIADGRGIAAALQLGASGAQLGTAFLTAAETAIAPVYRRTLLEPRAANTRLTKLFTGRPARAIVTRYLDELREWEDETLEYPLQRVLTQQLSRAAPDDPEFQIMLAGQNASQLRELPARELFELLVRQTEHTLARCAAS
jgi:nitronate monooxygenase